MRLDKLSLLTWVVSASVLVTQIGCKGEKKEETGKTKGMAKTDSPKPKTDSPKPKDNTPAKYDSPDAVFKAVQSSLEKNDYAGFTRCLTPAAQEIFAGSLAFTAILMKVFMKVDDNDPNVDAAAKAKAKADVTKLDTTLAKHGVTKKLLDSLEDNSPPPAKPDPAAEEAAALAKLKKVTAVIKDKPAFVGDLMADLEAISKDQQGKSAPGAFLKQSLKDVKITGDSAEAKLTVKQMGKDVEETVNFKRVNDGWLLNLSPELVQKFMAG